MSGASVLLVVGVMLAASLDGLGPIRPCQRDAGSERAAVRQITQSFARAVRELVGSDRHKPMVRPSLPPIPDAGVAFSARHRAEMPRPAARLRSALIDLPPPTRA